MADLTKRFPELVSENLLILLRGRPSGMNYRFQQFSGLALLAGQIT